MAGAYGYWRDLEVGGLGMPLEFKGASAAFVGTRCFIFGGYGGGFSDETHCLECAEPLAPEWSVLQETSDEKPPRRAHHTTWAHGGGVWVFGGASSRGYLNDVWRLTLEGGKHPRGRWRECACVGEKPVPREGHTGVQIGTSLVVVGGYDGVSWRSDSYALNLDTLVWWRVVDQGAPNAMMGRSGGAQCGNQPVNQARRKFLSRRPRRDEGARRLGRHFHLRGLRSGRVHSLALFRGVPGSGRARRDGILDPDETAGRHAVGPLRALGRHERARYLHLRWHRARGRHARRGGTRSGSRVPQRLCHPQPATTASPRMASRSPRPRLPGRAPLAAPRPRECDQGQGRLHRRRLDVRLLLQEGPGAASPERRSPPHALRDGAELGAHPHAFCMLFSKAGR